MATEGRSRQPQKDAQPTSVYFPDPALLERVDALVYRTGLSRNKILVQIITSNIAAYEKKPALLLEVN